MASKYDEALAILDELDAADAAKAAAEQQPEIASRSTTAPLSPERMAKVQAKIDAGMLPIPGRAKTAWEAILDANAVAGDQFGKKVLFGIPGRVSDAVGDAMGVAPRQVDPIPEARRGGRRWEDYIPDNFALDFGTGLAGAGVDMATLRVPSGMAVNMAKQAGANLVEQEIAKEAGIVGPSLGRFPAAVARRLGASEAQTAVRPSVQTAANAVGTGAVFGATDAAIRGGDIGEVATGAIQGAAGNVLMSQLPPMMSKVEDYGNSLITSRAVKPLVGIGQGVKADKALAGLGKGDVELGERELARVVQDEGLAPIINGRAKNLQRKFDEKLDQVGGEELGPIRTTALKAEPDAGVSTKRIAERLKSIVGKENAGTDVHDDVDKAIQMLTARAEKIGDKSKFPVDNLLENAREFERDGFGKSQPKFADGLTARRIGRELRALVDERISKIYMKRPELVRQVIGREEPAPEPKLLPTGEDNPNYVAPVKRRPWERSQSDDLDLEILGDKYADARKRYADLKKIEPLVDQLAKRNAEHRPGLVSTLKHLGGNATLGALGYGIAGQHGLLATVAGAEGARAVMPYAERALARFGRLGAGPAIDPGIAGSEIARMAMPGLEEAYQRFLTRKDDQKNKRIVKRLREQVENLRKMRESGVFSRGAE